MAAFVPGFDHDVFISYAHIDNRSSGWVESLERHLREKLSELAGAEVSVWRDPKLKGNDFFDDAIDSAVRKSAVFIAVVSPRYVASESCAKEYKAFASSPHSARIGEASRLARVRKTPLPDGVHEPQELSPEKTLGFAFYREDEDDLFEFENDDALPGYTEFRESVKKLATAVEKVLRVLRNAHLSDKPQHVIFFPEVVKSLSSACEELKRELTGRGHTVVPEESLLSDGAFARDVAEQALSVASLAVHLFGGSYGPVPDGETRSLQHLAYDLAITRKLPQLVWLAPDVHDSSKVQDLQLRAIVDAVVETPVEEGQRLEVCKTDFLAFKEVVLESVARPLAALSTATVGKSVYLLFHDDDIDSQDLRAIRQHLLQAGYPVNLPAFEAPESQLRQLEESAILDNDATLIYYGNAKDAWVEQKRRFLLTALGRSERAAKNTRALFLCAPSTKPKQFKFGDFQGGKYLLEAQGFPPLLVLGDFEAFSAEKMTPFLSWLSEAPGD